VTTGDKSEVPGLDADGGALTSWDLTPLEVAAEVIRLEGEALRGVAALLGDEFLRAVSLVKSCTGKVVTSGVGKSGLVAKKIAATLTSTGTPSSFLHPVEGVHGDAGIVSSVDVALFVSQSGRGGELEGLLPIIRRLGVPVIAMTGSASSPVGRAADVVLETGQPVEACPFGLVPTSSTTAALALGDALAIAVLKEKGLSRDDFAFFHPGGVIGNMMLRRVKDIMHSGDRLPVVSEGASMRDALLEIVAKKLGLTAIVDSEGRLTGIITDGDIKRILLKGGDFWDVKAGEVMTRRPKTIGAQELVARAVQRMEQNPEGPITSLVVMDEDGRPEGVVHLHDCLKTAG
jgi:arabinose-5-phosphate isomerase